MLYRDLRPAIAAYAGGKNVMETLRNLVGTTANDDSIVEIAYDLQAGSYSRYAEANADYLKAYCASLATVLRAATRSGDRILDVGTGEMTTLAGVAAAGLGPDAEFYACDISWSRIKAGRSYFARHAAGTRAESFAANLFGLPLLDGSVDVVWTSHALEPNGGREVEAVGELLRVARRAVVLFEPSYENNSDAGRARMASLGYVRDLPGAIARAGGRLREVLPISPVSQPLNPTHAYIIEKAGASSGSARPALPWACPATRLAMEPRDGCFFSPASCLAYPVIGGIPVLRAEAGVLASALA